VPREKLLKDLTKAPGWSYHGPVNKIENKLGPGRYGKPNYIIDRNNFDQVENWYHYPVIPRYDIHGFLLSRPRDMIITCMDMLANVELYVELYDWEDNNGIQEIILTLEHDDTIIGRGENKILAAYDLYLETYYIENIMNIPALTNMTGAIDVNKEWNGQPTIIFKDFPDQLIKKYRYFFTFSPAAGNCIGTFKLVEDTFYVITEKPYRPRNSILKSSSGTGKATHVGGLITRRK
jgi:hypothetical protein